MIVQDSLGAFEFRLKIEKKIVFGQTISFHATHGHHARLTVKILAKYVVETVHIHIAHITVVVAQIEQFLLVQTETIDVLFVKG